MGGGAGEGKMRTGGVAGGGKSPGASWEHQQQVQRTNPVRGEKKEIDRR
jgi:hypothetical protein